MFRVEECAIGMGQRAHYAAEKDAQIKFGKEECVLGMGQRGSTENVLLMGAQKWPIKEEFVSGMGQAFRGQEEGSSVPEEVTILCEEVVEV